MSSGNTSYHHFMSKLPVEIQNTLLLPVTQAIGHEARDIFGGYNEEKRRENELKLIRLSLLIIYEIGRKTKKE
ncbi:UDP-N-acetylglucosamine--N-acetylmuramyl-(pentapeptide) pyrophosphoryl-undecaprenol N-acetylglucosamine transferase [Dirofilaria immitis]